MVGEVNSSAFEFYEGLRVLIPGGLAVGLYSAIQTTFGTPTADISSNAIAALVVSLFIGLFLLFLDLPSGAAVFSYDAPVALLESWKDLKPAGRATHLNVYYEILDAEVPTGIRNRTHYLGAIYRIGFESVYFSATSLGVMGLMIVAPSVGKARDTASQATLRWIFLAGAIAHLGAVLSAIGRRYFEHRRKRRPPLERLLADLSTEIPWADRLILVATIAATSWFALGGPQWLGVFAVTTPTLLWGLRYYGGVRRAKTPLSLPGGAETSVTLPAPERQPSRQNLHAVSAAVFFGVAAISVCLCGVGRASAASPLSTSVTIGWVALSLVAGMLVVARSHEKRLLGSYGIQRAWFNQNKKRLETNGYFVPSSP